MACDRVDGLAHLCYNSTALNSSETPAPLYTGTRVPDRGVSDSIEYPEPTNWSPALKGERPYGSTFF